ncbi:MAG: D-aminoacyl-tRNA deacylase [Bacteroidota bacterium]
MIALVQRVSEASVTVADDTVGAIGPGLLVLLGIHRDDTEAEATWLARKVASLRVFPDEDGRMNRALLDLIKDGNQIHDGKAAGVLVVSQFTLYGSLKKGTRPSYSNAAGPDVAEPLYERFVALLEAELGQPVPTGVFGAHMDVALVNDGPVTLWLERSPG